MRWENGNGVHTSGLIHFFYILFAPPSLLFNGFLSLIMGVVITCLLLILCYWLLLLKVWYSVVALNSLLMFSVGSAYWLGHSHRYRHILWHNDSCGCRAMWTWADCNSRKMALHSHVSVLPCWDLFNLVVVSCFVVPTAQCKCVTGCVLWLQSVFKRSNWLIRAEFLAKCFSGSFFKASYDWGCS